MGIFASCYRCRKRGAEVFWAKVFWAIERLLRSYEILSVMRFDVPGNEDWFVLGVAWVCYAVGLGEPPHPHHPIAAMNFLNDCWNKD